MLHFHINKILNPLDNKLKSLEIDQKSLKRKNKRWLIKYNRNTMDGY